MAQNGLFTPPPDKNVSGYGFESDDARERIGNEVSFTNMLDRCHTMERCVVALTEYVSVNILAVVAELVGIVLRRFHQITESDGITVFCLVCMRSARWGKSLIDSGYAKQSTILHSDTLDHEDEADANLLCSKSGFVSLFSSVVGVRTIALPSIRFVMFQIAMRISVIIARGLNCLAELKLGQELQGNMTGRVVRTMRGLWRTFLRQVTLWMVFRLPDDAQGRYHVSNCETVLSVCHSYVHFQSDYIWPRAQPDTCCNWAS